jgi:hypothetical protein
MHKRHASILTIVALLSIGLTATAAVSQTKPNTTSPAKKSSPVVAKTIPTIKCTDPDTMTACKSFKQLVEARDRRILDILMGAQSASGKLSGYYRHIAYVCFAKTSDEFRTVDFDLPKGKSYKPYLFYLSEETVKMSIELSAFLGPSTSSHPVDPSIQDQWYEEHLNREIYDFGSVDTHEYTDGLDADWEMDYGKWARLSETQNDPAGDNAATFEGAYVWLERHTGSDKDSHDIGDDPEHAHISIIDGSVHIHYRFETKTGAHIFVELSIQASTGRFTESLIVHELPSLGSVESTGTCMTFKQ